LFKDLPAALHEAVNSPQVPDDVTWAELKMYLLGSKVDIKQHKPEEWLMSFSNIRNGRRAGQDPNSRALSASANDSFPAEYFHDDSGVSDDVESLFSAPDSMSSNSSLADVMGVSDEFIALLIEHDSLKPLFQQACRVLDDSFFKQKFKTLLKQFSNDLNEEAQKATEVLASKVVRSSRRKVTFGVWREIYGINSRPSIADALNQRRLGKAKMLDEALGRLNMADQGKGGIPDEMSDDNSSDDEEIDNILPNLKQVKRFLVNGQAFSQFQSRFEEILQSRGQDEVATTNAEAEVSLEGPKLTDFALCLEIDLRIGSTGQPNLSDQEPPILPPVQSQGLSEALSWNSSNEIDLRDASKADESSEKDTVEAGPGPEDFFAPSEANSDTIPNPDFTKISWILSVARERLLGLRRMPANVCASACLSGGVFWGNAYNHIDRLFRPTVPCVSETLRKSTLEMLTFNVGMWHLALWRLRYSRCQSSRTSGIVIPGTY
jgi:uncharacterized protein YeaO (DUF488 family)